MSHPKHVAPFKYQVEDTYTTRGKAPRECTIIDRLTTRNEKGEVVKRRYVSKHLFMGQWVFDYDVPQATVLRGQLFEIDDYATEDSQ